MLNDTQTTATVNGSKEPMPDIYTDQNEYLQACKVLEMFGVKEQNKNDMLVLAKAHTNEETSISTAAARLYEQIPEAFETADADDELQKGADNV